MASSREIRQGLQYQGEDEEIVYTITTTAWGSSPSAVSVAVKDERAGFADVTSTVMPTGSPTVAGDVITLPTMKALTRGRTYRVEVRFTSGANVLEPYFRVLCEM